MNQSDSDIIRELIRERGYDPLLLMDMLEHSSIEDIEQEYEGDLCSIPDDLEEPGHLMYLSFLMHLYPNYREDIMYSVLKSNDREDEDVQKAIDDLFNEVHKPIVKLSRTELEGLSESDRRLHLETFIRSKFDEDAFNEQNKSLSYEYSLEEDLLNAILNRVGHYLIDDSDFHDSTYPKVRTYLMTNVKKLEDYLREDVGYSLDESRDIIKQLMLSQDDSDNE